MAQLNLSTGATFATGLNPATTRDVVGNGFGTLISAGASGWDIVQLLNPTIDAAVQAATANAPFKLGIDDIYFTPLQIPEPAGGL